MLVELGDVVELSRDLADLQLGVDIVEPLRETALGLAGEAGPAPEEKAPQSLNARKHSFIRQHYVDDCKKSPLL